MVFLTEIFAVCLIVAGVGLLSVSAGLITAGLGLFVLTKIWVDAK